MNHFGPSLIGPSPPPAFRSLRQLCGARSLAAPGFDFRSVIARSNATTASAEAPARRRKQSRAAHTTLDCFVAPLLAMTIKRTNASSRRVVRPSFASRFRPQQNRGRREGRVAACTRGLTRKKELREARRPQVQAVTTGLPRAMVLRLIRALPGEPSRLPPSPPRSFQLRSDLAPRPWGARTTRFRRPRTSPPGAQTTASLAIRRRILMETFSSAARLARRSIAHGQAALRSLAHTTPSRPPLLRPNVS